MVGRRARSLAALLLLVPAPIFGAWFAYYGAPGAIGSAVYLTAKLWIVVLPLLWQFGVEHDFLSFSPLRREHRRAGPRTAVVLGLAMSAAVFVAWKALGTGWLDVEKLRGKLSDAGLTSSTRYVVFALYLTLVNSLIEEYVWRWFVLRQCRRLTRGGAIGLAALLFTLHHALAFHAQFGLSIAALASAGVFIAGCAWSWCYARYESIWPGWISHVLVDATGLAIGWRILFAE